MFQQNKIIIFVCIIIYYTGVAQTSHYKISSRNTPVGNLTVTKTENENLLQIEVISEVSIKVFIKVDLKYKLNCTYKDDELLFSSVTTYVNGKIHTTSKTEKNGANYTIVRDGHESKFLQKITYSGALLYFKEPKGITTVYSEFHAIDKPIKALGNHEYQITNPKNGLLSEYTYQNGILVTTMNHHSLMPFTLTKI
jgi:hypothetical protein